MQPEKNRMLNPQGRQKACFECAKAKRKCSLGLPNCSRCTKQRLTCTYPLQPSSLSSDAEHGAVSVFGEFGTPDMSMDVEQMEDDAFPSDLAIPPLSHDYGTDLVDIDLPVGITSLDALSNMMYKSPVYVDQIVVGRPSYDTEVTFSPAHVAPSARTRVDWSIEQLKLAPKMMVEQNGTPWQHAMLYHDHMPRHLQDAYAACALYIARNGTNDDFVANFIRERVREIVTVPIPNQLTEILARAHALMLYQIMLVFGGDVRLYNQAERLLPLVDEVGAALLPFSVQEFDPVGPLPFYPSTTAQAAWTSYMFRESLRRTILSLYHFSTLCHLLRGTTTPCSAHLVHGNRVTLSAHLWNARSAFDYAVVWNNEKHFLVKELDLTELMRLAEPEDVDTFGRMIMIGLQGEDDIRGWFYTKGGTL